MAVREDVLFNHCAAGFQVCPPYRLRGTTAATAPYSRDVVVNETWYRMYGSLFLQRLNMIRLKRLAQKKMKESISGVRFTDTHCAHDKEQFWSDKVPFPSAFTLEVLNHEVFLVIMTGFRERDKLHCLILKQIKWLRSSQLASVETGMRRCKGTQALFWINCNGNELVVNWIACKDADFSRPGIVLLIARCLRGL